ncbi:MAG TPA: trypsin-like peptidase domain-containing protein [Nitrososphaeraceae archaeon]|nr:trypsin-like peptidase domain-containing protein [Nitrososphaeraceae archaeon]
MKNSRTVILHVIILALLMLDTLIIQHSVMGISSSSISSDKSPNSYPSTPPLKAIFKQVEDSIVQITQTSNNVSNPLAENITLGSGFVYDKQRHIVTSYRAIGNDKVVDVTFVDGNRYTAKVIGADIYSDIAVLQIMQNNNTLQQQQQQPPPLPPLKPLVIGNSSELEVGDPVVAIGNPFGLSDSMITGVVSKIGSVMPDPVLGFAMPNVILTDIPINPGNSGGPLLNMQGEAVGMNIGTDLVGTFLPDPVLGFAKPHVFQTDTPIDSPSSTASFPGLGFAIPSSTITRIVPSLIEKGTYVHPYLGLSGLTLTADLARTVDGSGISGNRLLSNFKGIYVDTITKNGPADKAGLHGSTTDQYSLKHGGDIIVAIDGNNVTNTDDLTSYIDLHKSVGNNVILSVYRDGHTLNLKTTLTSRPSSLHPYAPKSNSKP